MSPTTDHLAYAVTQDDTVLCADCVTHICDDRQPSEVSRPGSTETFLFGIPALDEMGR